MKISLNWVREYTKVDSLDSEAVDKLVAKIGAQLGAVEKVEDLGAKYKGIVVAKVVSCVAHPNADKLSLCTIDDGKVTKGVKRDSEGHVQVVCGAPNVRRDQLVAWCPPGVIVPSTLGKDPLKLEARDIRGHKSYGMLASGHELGVSDDKAGILEIDEPAKPGQPLADIYKLDDFIVEIENKMFTHRPDCFGILGVARELAGIQGKSFKSPKWYLEPISTLRYPLSTLPLEVRNELPKLVPRFMVVAIAGVKIASSPIWLQSHLSRVGIKPINNVVDLTNYYMYLTGQPLHAYDYDKVAGLALVARSPKKGETLTLLGGKKINLHPKDIVIADGQRAIGLGGVMGGADTEVSKATKNIILECASFDKYTIHKTAMTHGLFTDAVTRFSKGQSPHQNEAVLNKVARDLIKHTGGQAASEVQDVGAKLPKPAAVSASQQFINDRLGLNLSAKEIAKLLENVEFKVLLQGATLKLTAPFWRMDVHIPEDVVEEVGRLYGYDHLPKVLPRRDLTPAKPEPLLTLKAGLRSAVANFGASEVLTYGFVHGNLMERVGQDPAQAYQISNALSPNLQYYRLSLIPSLLELVHPNIKAGYPEFALFEINKTHHKSQVDKSGLPLEEEHLAFVFSAEDKHANARFSGAPYYQAAKYLTELLGGLGIRPTFAKFSQENHKSAVLADTIAPFEPERSAYVLTESGDVLGIIGEFKLSLSESLKLPVFAAGFELNILQIMRAQSADSSYVVKPRYPGVTQDISLKVSTKVTYQQLLDCVWEQLLKNQPENVYSSLSPIDIYQKDRSSKNITLRLKIASYQRTLEAPAVNALLDKIAKAAKSRLGATRI